MNEPVLRRQGNSRGDGVESRPLKGDRVRQFFACLAGYPRMFMKRWNLWILILFILLLAVNVGYGLWKISYNPGFCNLCHIIRPYVASYRNSPYLDSLHREANVGCKDCHRVSPIESARELVAYVTSNYKNPLRQRELPMEDCLYCHRGYASLAQQTSHLEPNPHASHLGEIGCGSCHRAHRESELFCHQCHTWNLTPR